MGSPLVIYPATHLQTPKMLINKKPFGKLEKSNPPDCYAEILKTYLNYLYVLIAIRKIVNQIYA